MRSNVSNRETSEGTQVQCETLKTAEMRGLPISVGDQGGVGGAHVAAHQELVLHHHLRGRPASEGRH